MEDIEKNESLSKNESLENDGREEVFSRVVRAGKRTYFFDVKTTRSNDYFLTITESKKQFRGDGRHFYEKHKLFLYKEDFDKFVECFQETIDFIKSERKLDAISSTSKDVTTEFSDISFEDLEGKTKV